MICAKHDEEKVLWAGRWKCKSCNRDYQRKWLADNRPIQRSRIKANNKKRVEKNVKYVHSYLLAHPCISCGESDPIVLQFDHRDPTTKVDTVCRVSRSACSVRKLQEEIDKCDVLCANCHTRRTAVQFGWRKLDY